MKVGDIVQYTTPSMPYVRGIVTNKEGKKWVIVQWEDKVSLKEHIDDLKIISKST